MAVKSRKETRRQGPTPDEWISHRPILEFLYLEQGKDLQGISSIMHHDYGFKATPRQYVHRFAQWGFRKNIPHDVMQAMVAIRSQRTQEGKDTEFTWNGRNVDSSRLDRFIKREGVSCVSQEQTRSPIPQGIRYSTPAPECLTTLEFITYAQGANSLAQSPQPAIPLFGHPMLPSPSLPSGLQYSSPAAGTQTSPFVPATNNLSWPQWPIPIVGQLSDTPVEPHPPERQTVGPFEPHFFDFVPDWGTGMYCNWESTDSWKGLDMSTSHGQVHQPAHHGEQLMGHCNVAPDGADYGF
ncbi:Clr5 domain-containing protein [Cercophora newfieldiana]|uniref:Clr5 domain-containing protein n=1 Tax=Cercophora newfieldiana TaxID=92897 RepID=A0AA39XQQ7_9PEZI|nr:Clr5 domain-containing protein [Cercophora newfieldiana]